MQYFSQFGQDRFLFENFFYGKRNGVFVDVGARDGEQFSNTLFFERFLGWRGLCVEPNPSAFAKLAAGRKAICRHASVSDPAGADVIAEETVHKGILGGITRYVRRQRLRGPQSPASAPPTCKAPVTQLSSLLEMHGLRNVDYCSICTAGSEFEVLSGLDFDAISISVFTIKNIHDKRIPDLMEAKGYGLVSQIHDDCVFSRRDFKRLPQTTVICAVWHRDPNRFDLLRGHMANLARQTVPIDAIYVFDNGDAAPSWLESKSISVRHPLTIYQAWNVALSLVQTPLVMNLNLDDRLAADAVELMENALARENGCAVGGDWKICYSQEETDGVDVSYPAQRLPFTEEWPIRHGTLARLGSGTGQSGSFGPAVLWRVDAHIGMPRYPWRFMDGTRIELVGDAAWWSLLRAQPGRKILRLPAIIGHYHSHPGDQAEFRSGDHDELQRMKDIGVSLL